MSILLMSRPIVNAGDFLFSEKSSEAFDVIAPNVEVERGHISEQYALEYLNRFEAIVVAGGPLYDNKFLNPDAFPMLKLLEDITPPIYFLSAGWYGRDNTLSSIFSYRFDNKVLDVLKTIESRGGAFSCRDDITALVLKNNGLNNVSMVGCTAWYVYNKLNSVEPVHRKEIKKIVISDQGITKDKDSWNWKYKSLVSVVKTVSEFFHDSKIVFTFNGGINTKFSAEYNESVVKLLREYKIDYFDISGSSKGFSVYDDADLHIGFRVHSHIYCMSNRIPSILISEDARGSGCNESMGLRDIKDYCVDEGGLRDNEYLDKELKYYLQELILSDFKLLCSAYIKMNVIFESCFKPFIRRICDSNGWKSNI